MKTQIKNILATSFAALVLTAGSLSAKAIENHSTKTSAKVSLQVEGFKKVAVTGNVEVTFIQSNNESVAYADNSNGQVKVMQNGDLLTITPSGAGAAKLIVYVKNIYRIQGSGNAVIKTEGELNSAYLQVFLKDNATASINTKSTGLFTTLNDNAVLKLSGATETHTLETDNNSTLSMSHFVAKNTHVLSQTITANNSSFALVK